MGRREDLDTLYDLIGQLSQRLGGSRYLGEPTARDGLPKRGVYFFFEPGEYRADGKVQRIVRVGTHAVQGGARTTLWGRLAQHRGRLAGGGHHRGSIFRLHVGTALLNRGMGAAAAAAHWGRGDRRPEGALREAENQVELLVSQYIRSMPFLWVAVDDPPGTSSHRKVIETGTIALLSNLNQPAVDPPSPDWLGHWADRPEVRGSGLWNVKHTDEPYDPAFLPLLGQYIEATPRGRWQG